MERLKSMLALPRFHTLLFFFFFILFGWPLLSIADKYKDTAIYMYLFLAWGITIISLSLVAVSLSRLDTNEAEEQREE